MAELIEVLCGFAALLLVGSYYYFTYHFDYWKKRGIPGPKPIPVFGNIKDVILRKTNIGDYMTLLYNEYKNERVVGMYFRRTPVLMLKDPELIKDVLIRDFSVFPNRGLPLVEKADPLSANLLNLEVARWRPIRTKLSPVFTSGKLKEMFSMIVQSSEKLEQYLAVLVAKNEPIECRELTAKFTTDVIGSCAFGIETNTLTEEDNEFRRMGRAIFQLNFKERIRLFMRQSMPGLYQLLGYVLPESAITKFYTRLIIDTMDYRKKNNILRHDFVGMLLDMQQNPEKMADVKFTNELIAAQAFVFFAAGFETSSTTMANALYELAQNQDIQNKLREEIREEYERNNGDLAYENVKKMSYLDKVFRETLRKYPPGNMLPRQSIANYTFKDLDLSVPSGMRVMIPVYAIHRDPEIYPNPDVFDPERFNEDAVATRHPQTYLPFGDGPRNCIGARFAVYQTKIGLIKLLRNYKVDVCEKTEIPYKHDPISFLLAPIGGIYLNITAVGES